MNRFKKQLTSTTTAYCEFTFQINEAGRRWQQLVKGEWHTSATLQPTNAEEDILLRGFQGSYNINIKHQGNVIKTQTFNVDNGVQAIRVIVNV